MTVNRVLEINQTPFRKFCIRPQKESTNIDSSFDVNIFSWKEDQLQLNL